MSADELEDREGDGLGGVLDWLRPVWWALLLLLTVGVVWGLPGDLTRAGPDGASSELTPDPTDYRRWALLRAYLGVLGAASAAGIVAQALASRRTLTSRLAELLDDPELDGAPRRPRLTGRHEEREVTIEVAAPAFALRQVGRDPATITLKLRHAPAVRVRIRVDAGRAAAEKAQGQVEDVRVAHGWAFDQRYLVETDEDPTGGAMADAEVRDAIHAVFERWGMDELRVAAGQLVVEAASPLLDEVEELLESLERIASAYDRRPAPEVRSRASFAWVGGVDAAARCPFCRDSLAGELVACEGCATLVHGECHEENGGCPILGCSATAVTQVGAIAFEA